MQFLTHFPLLKALGWALFDSLWQMAALWLLYSLLMAVFNSAAARIRHTLALWALGLGTAWTGVTFFGALLLAQSSKNFWMVLLSPTRSSPGWFWESCRTFMDAALSYGSTIYLLVLSFLLIRYVGYFRHTRRLTRNGLTAMPAGFRVFTSSTALQLGIRKPVKAWLSSLIDVPVTLGFLKPVILLPVAMISRLTTQQVEAILIHELGHIRRKDYLLHMVVTVLEGLFFFNPFTRLLVRQLKKEREHCCDDLVLQFKYDPHAYISALLSLAALHQPVQKLAVAATGSGDKWLLERAKRILKQPGANRSRPGARPLLLFLVTALVAVLMLYTSIRPSNRTGRAMTASQPAGRAEPVTPALQPAHPAFPQTAASGETSLNRSMRSTPPPDLAKRQRSTARHQDNAARSANVPGDDGNSDFFVNIPDNTIENTDNNPMTLLAAADDESDPSNGAANVDRDFVLNTPMAIASGPSITIQQGAPVVPNSSFYYQYTIGDSSRHAEQQLYLQLSAQREVLAAIAQLQQQTAAQLKALANLQTRAAESVRLRNQVRAQQQKIQLDYLRKIRIWQQKLEKTAHVKVIVYI